MCDSGVVKNALRIFVRGYTHRCSTGSEVGCNVLGMPGICVAHVSRGKLITALSLTFVCSQSCGPFNIKTPCLQLGHVAGLYHDLQVGARRTGAGTR